MPNLLLGKGFKGIRFVKVFCILVIDIDKACWSCFRVARNCPLAVSGRLREPKAYWNASDAIQDLTLRMHATMIGVWLHAEGYRDSGLNLFPKFKKTEKPQNISSYISNWV